MKFSKKLRCLLFFILLIEIFNFSIKEENSLHETRKRKSSRVEKTQFKNKIKRSKENETKVSNSTNNTKTIKRISKPDYVSLNRTFVTKDVQTFKNERNEWDYKLISSQLDEIFSMFTNSNNKQSITMDSTRGAIKLFVENFELCDDDKDNLLTITEFKACLKKNEYFKIFDLDLLTEPEFVKKIIENNKNYTALNDTDSFSNRIFVIIDENQDGYMNFYDFMILRLISFSWRKCENQGLFISETQFECAIEIVAKTKTLQSNSLKIIFESALEISNFFTERYLDLPTFILVSLNYRLYGKINRQSNGNVHKDQLGIALRASLLPNRYDVETVEVISKLFDNLDSPNGGIDPHTFLFIDIFLRMFKINQNLNSVDYDGFVSILTHNMIPKKYLEEFVYVPQFSFTADSYNKFVSGNTPNKLDEGDFFLKKFRFRNENKNEVKSKAEVKSKVSKMKIKEKETPEANKSNTQTVTKSNSAQTTTTTTIVKVKVLKNKTTPQKGFFYFNFNTNMMKNFNFEAVSEMFFNLMDFPKQQKINFEEFLNFIQLAYMMKNFDTHKIGKLTANELYQKFSTFVGFPKPSVKILSRIDNLKLVGDNTYLNLFYTYGLFRIEDFKNLYARKDDLNNLINEVDLKLVLQMLNINEYPIKRLDHDIITHKDNDKINLNLPYYDYKKAIGDSINTVSILLQNEENFKIVQANGLKLENTVFENFSK